MYREMLADLSATDGTETVPPRRVGGGAGCALLGSSSEIPGSGTPGAALQSPFWKDFKGLRRENVSRSLDL